LAAIDEATRLRWQTLGEVATKKTECRACSVQRATCVSYSPLLNFQASKQRSGVFGEQALRRLKYTVECEDPPSDQQDIRRRQTG